MKRLKQYLFASALLMTGCTQSDPAADPAADYGTLKIDCTADGRLGVRSATAPDGSQFALRLTNAEGSQSWTTLAAFHDEQPLLLQGDWKAEVAYGDSGSEGYDRPYYFGSGEFELKPRQTNSVRLTAKIANAQSLVRTTEQFRSYFHDAVFTLTTGAGNAFDFAFASTSDPAVPDAAEPVYVRAGTSLSVTGTARRQHATDDDRGTEVAFPEQTLDAARPATCHIFEFDAANAGSAVLHIYLDDELTETVAIDIELNEGAIL